MAETTDRHGPDPTDPDSGMLHAAYKAAQVFAMLNTQDGEHAVEKLSFEDRHQLLVATGNCLKAVHDVVQMLCLGGPQSDRVRVPQVAVLFDLVNAIDGLHTVERAERELHKQLTGQQDVK